MPDQCTQTITTTTDDVDSIRLRTVLELLAPDKRREAVAMIFSKFVQDEDPVPVAFPVDDVDDDASEVAEVVFVDEDPVDDVSDPPAPKRQRSTKSKGGVWKQGCRGRPPKWFTEQQKQS